MPDGGRLAEPDAEFGRRAFAGSPAALLDGVLRGVCCTGGCADATSAATHDGLADIGGAAGDAEAGCPAAGWTDVGDAEETPRAGATPRGGGGTLEFAFATGGPPDPAVLTTGGPAGGAAGVTTGVTTGGATGGAAGAARGGAAAGLNNPIACLWQ